MQSVLAKRVIAKRMDFLRPFCYMRAQSRARAIALWRQIGGLSPI
jgi:hypothetical protein